MAYLDTQPLGRRLASLGTAGIIELAIGTALIAGLSVTIVPRESAPQIKATNIPDTVPPSPEPQASAMPIDTVPTAPEPRIDVRDTPTVLPSPTTSEAWWESTATRMDPGPTPTIEPSPRILPASPKPANNPASWITTRDYPARDLREGNQGTTRFRVVVGSDGRAKACELTGSSGSASLDKAACDNVMRRARFEAATDETGAKVVGTYASSVRWQIPR